MYICNNTCVAFFTKSYLTIFTTTRSYRSFCSGQCCQFGACPFDIDRRKSAAVFMIINKIRGRHAKDMSILMMGTGAPSGGPESPNIPFPLILRGIVLPLRKNSPRTNHMGLPTRHRKTDTQHSTRYFYVKMSGEIDRFDCRIMNKCKNIYVR